MGFNARFSLYIRDMDGNTIGGWIEEIQKWINDHEIGKVLNGLAFVDLDQTEMVCDSDDRPWKDEYDSDITELSETFPSFVFNLFVEGENRFDVWNRYYMNGDDEECLVQYRMPKPKRIPWECCDD